MFRLGHVHILFVVIQLEPPVPVNEWLGKSVGFTWESMTRPGWRPAGERGGGGGVSVKKIIKEAANQSWETV